MASFDPHGGSFLLTENACDPVTAPEPLGSEARMLADAARDFMRGEVLPAADRLQSQEPGLMRSLLEHAGQLGLMGLEIPESYGGLGLAKSTSALISEAVSVEPAFAVSHNVHTSVATIPVMLFGAPEQRSHMLPPLASGEWIGAYALSEAQAGSDAMAVRTRAVARGDGYRLSGEKMWITNAAFADLFTVFARVEGQDGLTAFLVERDRQGLTVGREERKVGLKGSSTCRVLLDNLEVPAANRIGREGEGGKIALNTLNLGRFKISASSLGRSKDLLGIAARYATERHAFGQPIAEFGLIRQKLARMASRVLATESMVYRLAGLIDAEFAGIDLTTADPAAEYSAAAEEYAAECAMLKVFATETLDLCADECLQIHGGYGYTEEFAAGRAWRDARVNRIYEGTNEINRMSASQMLLRRMRGGRLSLNGAATEEAALFTVASQVERDHPLPQEALGALTDLMCELFARQSVVARLETMPPQRAALARDLADYFLLDAMPRRWAGMVALGSILRRSDSGLAVSLAPPLYDAVDIVDLGARIGRGLTDAGCYPL